MASLYSILEQNLKDLEEAEDKYEDAVTNASFNLQTLQLKLSSLQQAVTEAKENYEIQQAQAKLTYETSLSGAERAESDYNTTVEKVKSDLAALKSTYEDAKENLELFESSVGDGYFYASEDGTILRTMVRAEQADFRCSGIRLQQSEGADGHRIGRSVGYYKTDCRRQCLCAVLRRQRIYRCDHSH